MAHQLGSLLGTLWPLLADAGVGIAAGAAVLGVVTLARRVLPQRQPVDLG
jgi:hypothetical protein